MSRAGVRLLEEADIQAIRMRQAIFNPQPGLGALLVPVAGGAAHAAAVWPFSRGARRIADRLTIKRIPPSWGSKASKTRRSMAKSSPDGRSIPKLAQATILIAASI
jgi:hypothetical protein